MSYLDLNVNLSEEDVVIREKANEFAREVMRPISVQLDRMLAKQAFASDSPFWDFMRKGYQLGYHKMSMPKEIGGMGLNLLQQTIVWEELAWGSWGMALALSAGTQASLPLTFQNQDFIKRYTIPYCECTDASVIGCWGITEPDHGSDVLMPFYPSFRDPAIKAQCQARLDGDEWVINGQKAAWVSRGTIANVIALFCQVAPAMGHGGGGIFIMPGNLPGISRGEPLDTLGIRDLNQGELYFDGVRVAKDSLLVGPDKYEAGLARVLSGTTAATGIYCVGLARAAFEEALNHARTRVQGGKRLADHDNIQQKILGMFRKIEAARLLCRNAYIYNRTTGRAAVEYGMAAKTFATQAALEVTSDAIQIIGANGLAKGCLVEKLFRDARTALIADGSDDILSIAGGRIVASTYPRPQWQ